LRLPYSYIEGIYPFAIITINHQSEFRDNIAAWQGLLRWFATNPASQLHSVFVLIAFISHHIPPLNPINIFWDNSLGLSIGGMINE
jgi:hypothetical protein